MSRAVLIFAALCLLACVAAQPVSFAAVVSTSSAYHTCAVTATGFLACWGLNGVCVCVCCECMRLGVCVCVTCVL